MNRREFVAMAPAFPVAAVTATLTLKEDGKDPVELDVSVLKVQRGDILVLRFNGRVSHEQAERIKRLVESQFNGLKAMVFDKDLELEGVLRGPA